MAEVLGPTRAQYEEHEPIGAAGNILRNLRWERPPWADRVTLWGFGQQPIDSYLADAKGTSHAAGLSYGSHDTIANIPGYGARGELTFNDYLSGIIDAYRQQKKHNTGHGRKGDWKDGGYKYWTDQQTVSPGLKLRYETEYGTPYVYGGPAWTRTEMGDHIGSSPVNLDFGWNAGAGYQWKMDKLLQGLLGFIEGNYNTSRSLTADPEGAINGRDRNLNFRAGLGFNFGKKD